MVNPGNRIPIRGKSTGSVRMLMPKRLMRTVAWPIQAAVTWASFHFKGSGLAKAGAIGRQLSIVHSRQRCPIQRRTRGLPKVGWLDALTGCFECQGDQTILSNVVIVRKA